MREVLLQQDVHQTVVEGATAVVSCGLREKAESPYWRINGTIYTFAQVPLDFELLGYTGIFIAKVGLDMDGFTFQCVGFERPDRIDIGGVITHLRVLPGNTC